MSKNGEPNVQIEFGAMAPPIGEQLAAIDGFEWLGTETAKYQRLADSVALLSIHGVLTDNGRVLSYNRLAKMIARNGVAK